MNNKTFVSVMVAGLVLIFSYVDFIRDNIDFGFVNGLIVASRFLTVFILVLKI